MVYVCMSACVRADMYVIRKELLQLLLFLSDKEGFDVTKRLQQRNPS